MEQKAIAILKACAWLNLIAGVAVAIYIWMSERVNTTVMVMVIVYAVAGIIGWGFLLVVSSIAESLIEVRANTAEPMKSGLFDREAKQSVGLLAEAGLTSACSGGREVSFTSVSLLS